MKSIILAASLLTTTSIVRAAPCAQTKSGPCTPDDNATNQDTHDKILGYITDAQNAEPTVKNNLDAYLAIRDLKDVSAEDKMAAFQKYRWAKLDQDALYRQAIEDTAKLYHVRPKHTDRITIGEPDEADMHYMSGISALWDPRVTDSGPGVSLAVRIDGADGPHFSGTREMNLLKKNGEINPDGLQAITLPDGRVLILKDTIAVAVDVKENLGYLAAVIYHETRHFNRLSWKDKKTGENRSWAAIDKEERDAYADEKRLAKDVFNLDQDDIDDLERKHKAYANAVRTGVPITDDHLTAEQEATWKAHYEHQQVNLDEEYTKLSDAVYIESANQLAAQVRQREEEQARKRSEDEVAAAWKVYYRREMENEAARCGYTFITANPAEPRIIAFADQGHSHRHGVDLEYATDADGIRDLKIMVMIARACDYADAGIPADKVPACNDAAPALQNPISYDLQQKIEVSNSSWNADCAKNILAKASRITDYKSFVKIVGDFQKADKIKRDKEADRQREREEEDEGRKENSRGGTSREPSGREKDRHWDPLCGCWIEKQ